MGPEQIGAAHRSAPGEEISGQAQVTLREIGVLRPQPVHAEGWQVTAAYFVLPAQLQAVIKSESFDPNTSFGGDAIQSTTFGLNYYLRTEDIKIMLNYIDGRVPGSGTDGGRLVGRVQLVF